MSDWFASLMTNCEPGQGREAGDALRGVLKRMQKQRTVDAAKRQRSGGRRAERSITFLLIPRCEAPMPVCNVVRFIPPPYNDSTGRFPTFSPASIGSREASERAATVVATEAAKQDQPSLL